MLKQYSISLVHGCCHQQRCHLTSSFSIYFDLEPDMVNHMVLSKIFSTIWSIQGQKLKGQKAKSQRLTTGQVKSKVKVKAKSSRSCDVMLWLVAILDVPKSCHSTHMLYHCDNTAENHVTPFYSDVYLEH